MEISRQELLERYEHGERDFIGLDLSGINLRDAALRDVSFAECDLQGADLSGADLSSADLSDADCGDANLCGTNLQDADCRGAIFTDAALVADCHGKNINFSHADFRGDALDQGILESSIFAEADFSKSHLSQFIFIGCDFSGADFSHSRLSEVSFIGCNLDGADFSGAFLDMGFKNCAVDGAKFCKTTLDIANENYLSEIKEWKNVDFSRTIFNLGRYVRFPRPEGKAFENIVVMHVGADLSNQDLSGANLQYINTMADINLSNTNLRYAKLSEDDVHLEGILRDTVMPDGSLLSNGREFGGGAAAE